MLPFRFENKGSLRYHQCATSQAWKSGSTRFITCTLYYRKNQSWVKLLHKEDTIRFQADNTHSWIIHHWSATSNSQNKHKSHMVPWKIQMNFIPQLFSHYHYTLILHKWASFIWLGLSRMREGSESRRPSIHGQVGLVAEERGYTNTQTHKTT